MTAEAVFVNYRDPQQQTDRLREAVTDYLTDSVMTAFFPSQFWRTDTGLPLMDVGKAVVDFNEKLNNVLENQVATMATWSGVPHAIVNPIAGIAAKYALEPLAEPLGEATTIFESFGLAVGLLTGQPHLAVPCAQALAHDAIQALAHDAIEAIENHGFTFESTEPASTVSDLTLDTIGKAHDGPVQALRITVDDINDLGP